MDLIAAGLLVWKVRLQRCTCVWGHDEYCGMEYYIRYDEGLSCRLSAAILVLRELVCPHCKRS